MTTPTLITMLVILTFVVGGFISFLTLALRKERGRDQRPQSDAGED